MAEQLQQTSDAGTAPAQAEAPKGGLIDGDIGEVMAQALAKHSGGGIESQRPDTVQSAATVSTPETAPVEATPEPAAQPNAELAALKAKLGSMEALVQSLLQARQAPEPVPTPAPAAPAKTEPDDPFDRALLAGLRSELGTDDVPTEVAEKYRRALSLRSLASSPGWDTPEVKTAIANAEREARAAIDGYRHHGSLAQKIAELEKKLSESVNKPQAEAQRVAAAESEFSNHEAIPADYPVMRKVAQLGGGKALGRAAAQAFGERYGQVPGQEFARWLAAVEQQMAPVAQLAEKHPEQREMMLTMLKSSNPALAEVLAPMLTATPAPAATPAKPRTVTPPTIPQSSGGGIPRPATKDVPLHQMAETDFDDLMVRKLREHGV